MIGAHTSYTVSYDVGQRIDLYQYLCRCHPNIRVNFIHLITIIIATGAKKIPQKCPKLVSKAKKGIRGHKK